MFNSPPLPFCYPQKQTSDTSTDYKKVVLPACVRFAFFCFALLGIFLVFSQNCLGARD